MVDGSKVRQDLEDIKKKMINYSSQIEQLSGNWTGDSYDNITSKANSFSSSYLSTIESQMNAFATACDTYTKYLKQKDILKTQQSIYNECKKNIDTYGMAVANSNITTCVNNIETLEKQIKSNLSQACSGKLEKSEVSGASFGEFVNYYQTDYSQPYSQGTIATSGCGPTSLAMCLTYITGQSITPVETAKLGNGTYTCSKGTKWDYFHDISKKYNVDCEQHTMSADNINKFLKDGKPVIVSMGPGTFTSSGHFIVLTGFDKDGKITVADPNSRDRSKKSYDISVFTREGKQMWSF